MEYMQAFIRIHGKQWETLFCKFALNFFTTGYLLEGANDTQLVLIPKVNHPENFTQLRQISLCNVIYN